MYCMTCTNRVDKCRCVEDTLSEAQAEIARLQAEVERLRIIADGKWKCIERDEDVRIHNAAIEEAAQAILGKPYLLSIGTPEEGPFTRQDRTRDEVIEQAVAAIRALKPKEPT